MNSTNTANSENIFDVAIGLRTKLELAQTELLKLGGELANAQADLVAERQATRRCLERCAALNASADGSSHRLSDIVGIIENVQDTRTWWSWLPWVKLARIKNLLRLTGKIKN